MSANFSTQQSLVVLFAFALSGCKVSNLVGRAQQTESIRQDFRYLACENAPPPDTVIRKHCSVEDDVGVCVAGHRLQSFLGDTVYLLRNEYEPALRSEHPEMNNAEALLVREIASGGVLMNGMVTFEIYPHPKSHEDVYLLAYGDFRAQQNRAVWAIGNFHLPLAQYNIQQIMDQKFLDVRVDLTVIPLESRKTWIDRAFAVYQQTTHEPKNGQANAAEGAQGKISADPISGTDNGTMSANPPTTPGRPEPKYLEPDTEPESLLYRIFLKTYPKHPDTLEIDYNRGHIISTSDGSPLGCLFFEPSNGIKLIDFGNRKFLRLYSNVDVADVEHVAKAVRPGIDTDPLCKKPIVPLDACGDLAP